MTPGVETRRYVGPPIRALIDLHTELLAEHGGAPGVRDLGALEAALARPFQLMAYAEEKPGVIDLAAAVCAGILRNHPFVDGNKRAAFVALGLVLGLNGFELDAKEREAADRILALAAGELTEAAFRDWLLANAVEAPE